MVDNIRFGIKLKNPYNFDFFENHKKVKGYVRFQNQGYTTYKLYLFRNNVNHINDYKVRSIPSLEITIRVGGLINEIRVENSLRKWYYGKNSMKDFNLIDFIHCIQLVSQFLKITIDETLKAKNYYLELGANLRFRAEDKSILISIFDHENLKITSIINNNQTVMLEGVNRTISIYNKLEEMFNADNFTKKVLKKISEKYFFGRFEIKIDKVSGVQFSKLKTGTIGELILNWKLVAEYWESEMLKIRFVEFLSPPIKHALIEKKIPLDDFLCYLGMKNINASQFKFLLDEFYNKNYGQKAKVRKRLTENTIMFDALKGSQTIPNFNNLISKKASYFKAS